MKHAQMEFKITEYVENGVYTYAWHVTDGPDGIDGSFGICSSIGECFERLVKFKTILKLDYQ